MARPVSLLSEINDTKELWKIEIRVQHLWNVQMNNKDHFEMIFVDKSGDEIQVVVPPMLQNQFADRLMLGHTYTVSNFKVHSNAAAYRPCRHPFMLKFTGGTSVSDDNKKEISEKPLVFTEFADILTGNFNKDVLIHVIGMVESIGYSHTTSGGKKPQVNMILRDHRNNNVHCTLWESYAAQFVNFVQGRDNARDPTVVVLQYAKVKEEGKFPLSVTNTYNVTILKLDADFTPIKNFIASMPKDSIVTVSGQLGSSSQLSSHSSEKIQLTPVQKLLTDAVVLPIAEIIQLTGVKVCATVAETKVLVSSPFGWCYRACHVCPCIARGDKPPFICEAKHETEAEIFRYKIEIEVTHGGKSCKFMFWNRECELLIGLSAAQLRNTMIQAGISDPLEFPLALDQMLGQEMAYRVKWNPRYKNCSVIMIVRNDPVIKQLKAPWEAAEEPEPVPLQSIPSEPLQIKESVDEAITDPSEECLKERDLEISSKHNLCSKKQAGKRLINDGSSDSTTSEGLPSDAELSSNKLKVFIKQENND